ncbi:MAG TPA: glycosyltransferase [Solirubrobacteraceae bacterium]
MTRTVLFHRRYRGFSGGHLKVHDYFEHARSAPGHDARVAFSADSTWDEANPWRDQRDALAAADAEADVLFLGGVDWKRADPRHLDTLPVLNLIQHVRHAEPRDPRHVYLERRAIRICVSPEVRDAIEATARVNGPVVTIPGGLDVAALPAAPDPGKRDVDHLVLAVKDRPLGAAVARRLRGDGARVELVERPIPRGDLLALMGRARVAVLLPHRTEGFYLPALEAMALGAAVVCPDCVGNRSFCRDGHTCFVPARDERAIADAARAARAGSEDDLAPLRAAARREAEAHDVAEERRRFHDVLGRLDELWGRR